MLYLVRRVATLKAALLTNNLRYMVFEVVVNYG